MQLIQSLFHGLIDKGKEPYAHFVRIFNSAAVLHPEEEEEKYRSKVRDRHESVNNSNNNNNSIPCPKRLNLCAIVGGDHRSNDKDLLNHQLFFDVVILITQVAVEICEPLFDASDYSYE